MELAVLDVLQQSASESNGEKRLSKTQIRQKVIEKYKRYFSTEKEAGAVITPSKLRTAIDRIIAYDDISDHQVLFFKSFEREDGSDYRTGFYVRNNFSDTELLFFIDSIMYSNAIDTPSAEDLTKRLQSLANKRLSQIAPYATELAFGPRGPMSNAKVLDNMRTILEAISAERQLKFTLHICDIVGDRIVCMPAKKHRVIPLQVYLNNGQYYMLAQYELNKTAYSFRLDLMTDLHITKKQVESSRLEVDKLVPYRSEYIQQHPFGMGGDVQRFTLRVNRNVLTILLSTFGANVTVVPGTITPKTVDVWVKSSLQGMKYWLLMNYKAVSVVKASPEFMDEMAEAVDTLRDKYAK